jgi:REP element-mobilizing transposase RayT
MFLDLLRELHETFQVNIHAYCLMGNHYHLLVETPLANLSRAMRTSMGSRLSAIIAKWNPMGHCFAVAIKRS